MNSNLKTPNPNAEKIAQIQTVFKRLKPLPEQESAAAPRTIVRDYDEAQDREDVKSWWLAQKWPNVPEKLLSPTGFVAVCNGVKAAAGWLFVTNSQWGLLEFVVANPEVRHAERDESLRKLIDMVEYRAKKLGLSWLFLSTRSQTYISRLVKLGWQETDKGMTSLIKNLEG